MLYFRSRDNSRRGHNYFCVALFDLSIHCSLFFVFITMSSNPIDPAVDPQNGVPNADPFTVNPAKESALRELCATTGYALVQVC